MKATDHKGMENMKQIFKEEVEWCHDPVTAAADRDAVALLTDWPQYTTLPFRKIAATMNQPDHLRRPQLPASRCDARDGLPVLPHGPAGGGEFPATEEPGIVGRSTQFTRSPA